MHDGSGDGMKSGVTPSNGFAHHLRRYPLPCAKVAERSQISLISQLEAFFFKTNPAAIG